MTSRRTEDPKTQAKSRARAAGPVAGAPKTARKKALRIPPSGSPGIHWPAVPGQKNVRVLALHYQLERSQWWSPEILLEHQLLQLGHLLSHAVSTVPFHRRLGKELRGLRRGELTIDRVRRLPIMRRTDIQDAGPALRTRRLPASHGSTSKISTSGSTGRPITVEGTVVSGLFHRAISLRYHIWQDRDFSARVAAIQAVRGELAKAAERGTPVQWVPGFVSGPMMYFDVARPVSEQLDWLVLEDSDYLLTYPSNLMALLERSEATGNRPKRLSQVSTMGEVLPAPIRAACDRVWGVPVADAYSAQEIGIIALQCPDHPHYHVQAENILVEVLDDEGRPCAPGEVGRLVLTDLHNFATPLIRYEIGDYARVGEACSCGRGLPVIDSIVGRVHNMLVLPSGEKAWPVPFFSSELVAAAPVKQIQLVQRSLEDIDVNLVIARPLLATEEAALRNLITDRLGHPFTLNFHFVDEIPRSPNGKYEDFRSDLAPGAAHDPGSP